MSLPQSASYGGRKVRGVALATVASKYYLATNLWTIHVGILSIVMSNLGRNYLGSDKRKMNGGSWTTTIQRDFFLHRRAMAYVGLDALFCHASRSGIENLHGSDFGCHPGTDARVDHRLSIRPCHHVGRSACLCHEVDLDLSHGHHDTCYLDSPRDHVVWRCREELEWLRMEQPCQNAFHRRICYENDAVELCHRIEEHGSDCPSDGSPERRFLSESHHDAIAGRRDGRFWSRHVVHNDHTREGKK